MAKEVGKLKDSGSERALLGTIIKGGKDNFIDADGIVDTPDFSLPINRAVYASIKSLSEDPNCTNFDIETIKMKMKTLGFSGFDSSKDIEYLELLNSVNFDKGNIPIFAMQIKKYSVVRDLYNRYSDAIKYLGDISGNETLNEIISTAEGKIVDYINGINNENSLISLTENVDEYVEQLMQQEIIDQPGIPTGFPIYDNAIGGGFRPSTVNVIGARGKVGKSYIGLSVARNISKLNIPVLILDTELTEDITKNRLITMDSGCPIKLFETRKFKQDKDLVEAVRESAAQIKLCSIHYESIAGKSHTEALAIAKRWLVKHVGFDETGKANPCLIIYDYIKLMTAENITKNLAEYALLGFLITDMHNFAVKYSVPFLAFTQLNRDGIDGDDTSVIAGSDRILWLCSSLSLLKNKNEDDIAMGCGWEKGNKKLLVTETRFGSGLEYGDYINLHCSIRPHVDEDKACGLFREGLLFSQLSSNFNKS